MSRSRIWATAVLATAVASCSVEVGHEIDKPIDGKADAIARLCQDAGLPDDCDICKVRGWYGDGECDDFCAAPDPDCDTRRIRISCMDSFGAVDGWVSASAGSLRVDEFPFVASGMSVTLARLMRDDEASHTFAKYDVEERPNPNGDRYSSFSVPKALFDGTYQPTFVAYITFTSSGTSYPLRGCTAVGTASPEKTADADVMEVLANEYGQYFDDVRGTEWESLVDEVAADQVPEDIQTEIEAIFARDERFVLEFVYIVERNGKVLGYAMNPALCNIEECESGGSLYLDAKGKVVADHLED